MKKILIIIFAVFLINLISISALDYSAVNDVFLNFSMCYNSEGVYRNGSSLIIGNVDGSLRNVLLFNSILNSSIATQLNTGQYPLFYPTSQTNQTLHPISFNSGYNKLNVSLNQSNQLGTNLSVRLLSVNESFENMKSSCVAYYKFDRNTSTAFDYCGNGTGYNDGTLNGGVLWNSTGGINQTGGYQFDGVNDKITTSIDINWSLGFTMSTWTKMSSGNTSNGDTHILSLINQTITTPYFAISVRNITIGTQYKLRIILNSSGCDNTAQPNINMLDGNYYNLVGVYNGSDILFYINGIFNKSSTLSLECNNLILSYPKSNRLNIGYNGGSTYFNGSIDEVMIFNRSLSATEVFELYNKTSSKYQNIMYSDSVNITSSNVFDISTDSAFAFPEITYQQDAYMMNTPILLNPINYQPFGYGSSITYLIALPNKILRFLNCSPDWENANSQPSGQTSTIAAINATNNGPATTNFLINLTGILNSGWTISASNDSLSHNITLSSTAQTIWSDVKKGETKGIWLKANCSYISSNAGKGIKMWAN